MYKYVKEYYQSDDEITIYRVKSDGSYDRWVSQSQQWRVMDWGPFKFLPANDIEAVEQFGYYDEYISEEEAFLELV